MSESNPTLPSSPDAGGGLRPERLGAAVRLAPALGGDGALRPAGCVQLGLDRAVREQLRAELEHRSTRRRRRIR
ncbi:MAG TPA: hypothetical protein VHM02_08485, partial [Thermoanaerobaculia bacterium]|nr:hypothetical protein [Thermoanaerobaculia bacterium]